MSEQKYRDPLVAIAGTVGGVSLGVVLLFAIFASHQMNLVVWIIAALAAMGVALGALSARSRRPE
jgi:Zn-dependent protease